VLANERPTPRALDAGDSARFTSIFLASNFLYSQAESTPAAAPVTQTVSPLSSMDKLKMRRFVYTIFVMVALSACKEVNQNIKKSPSSTAFSPPTSTQMATSTISPSETPLSVPSLTPVPPSLILADFPLKVGATWKYSAEISFPDPEKSGETVKWTGVSVRKVVNMKISAEGKISFDLQEYLEPKPPPEYAMYLPLQRPYDYTIAEDGIYEFYGSMFRGKIFQYPLYDGLSWIRWTDWDISTNVMQIEGEVITPYQKLNHCYRITTQASNYIMEDVFCQKVGFVIHRYKSIALPQDNSDLELVSYESGQ
jgi:hypothetical protein